MTVVSNDPSWWPVINSNITFSYWTVAAGIVVVYDWVLTLGQEIELIWMQRWSLMTVLYLVIRYIGTPYSVTNILENMPLVSVTDAGCNITYYAQNGTDMVIYTMLGIIIITRLYAMYQGSKMILIFLVIIFLAVIITCTAIGVITLEHVVGEELILSGTYMCEYEYEGDDVQLLYWYYWTLYTVWEVLALCLSVWIAVKHFRDLRRLDPSTGSTIGDCFRVLIKYHVLYFASFIGVSFFEISPSFMESYSMAAQIALDGARQILLVVQTFVLGPRLILSVREYHAKLVVNSDTEMSMNSIVFQERIQISTSSTV